MDIPHTEIIVTENGREIARRLVPPGEYLIGRDQAADVQVTAGLISRKHAKVTVKFSEWLVEDLGSANGTFINGQRVTESTRVWPNQKIQIGGSTIELRRVKGATSGPEAVAPPTSAVRKVLPEEFLREKKYDIGGVIAQGGMGAILNAKEATIERTVAMKVMLDTTAPENLLRFIAEAKITGQLEHPNIVPVHELSVDEQEQVFYTMKFVRGITLKKVIDLIATGAEGMVKKYPLGQLLTVFQKVCDAIAFAHSKHVIHRDLKPENVMIGDYGEVLVMDWGLAKVLVAKRPATQSDEPARSIIHTGARAELAASENSSGTIMGTPQYMAPEQAIGAIDMLDARTDIYALGAILYEILTLHPPFEGTNPQEIVHRVAIGGIIPATQHTAVRRHPHLPGGRVPEALSAVAMKALARMQAARYQEVPELQAEIEAFQNGFATSAERAGVGKQFVLLLRRHRAVSIAIAAAFLLLLGISTAITTHVLRGRDRAEGALAGLQKAAPTLATQAETLVVQQQFNAAIEQLDFAITIAPLNADYRLRRAHLLEASLRLKEAAEAYRSVLALRDDDSATVNLALVEKLQAQWPAGGEPGAPLVRELYDSLRTQGRTAESLPLARRLGLGK